MYRCTTLQEIILISYFEFSSCTCYYQLYCLSHTKKSIMCNRQSERGMFERESLVFLSSCRDFRKETAFILTYQSPSV